MGKSTKIIEIEETLRGHIKGLLNEIDHKDYSDEHIKRVTDRFVEIFVQVDRLKQTIIKQTTLELSEIMENTPEIKNLIEARFDKVNSRISRLLDEDILWVIPEILITETFIRVC